MCMTLTEIAQISIKGAILNTGMELESSSKPRYYANYKYMNNPYAKEKVDMLSSFALVDFWREFHPDCR